jgi:hypothetical protein
VLARCADVAGHIFVSGSTVVVKNCLVHGAVEDGIVVNREGKLALEGTTVESCAGNGIAVIGGSQVCITGCSIRSCGENGLAAIGQPARRGSQTTVTLSGTTIERSGSRGVWADEGAIVRIQDGCTVRTTASPATHYHEPHRFATDFMAGRPSRMIDRFANQGDRTTGSPPPHACTPLESSKVCHRSWSCEP